jgi:pilus assembly protein CpaB
MRAVFGLVLVAGVGLAGSAVYMAQNFLGQTEQQLQDALAFNAKVGNLVEVYVVNKALKYGDPLTPDDVQIVYWQESALPETIFREEAVLFPPDAKGPRYVMRSVEPFEPVLSSRVTEPGEAAGLNGKLGPGIRAFDVIVGSASGVSGFVQPDDYVDIYWTGSADGTNGSITQLIESSIKIIAVDNATDEGQDLNAGGAQTVTVAGTPEQIARLAQAQATGRLSMSLVGSVSEKIDQTVEVDTKLLLNIQDAPAPVVEEEKVEKICTIKTRKGDAIVEVPIPCQE